MLTVGMVVDRNYLQIFQLHQVQTRSFTLSLTMHILKMREGCENATLHAMSQPSKSHNTGTAVLACRRPKKRKGKRSRSEKMRTKEMKKCAIVHFRVRREKCELLNVTELDEHRAGRVVQFFKRNMGGRLTAELQRNSHSFCSRHYSNFNALKREGEGKNKEKWIIPSKVKMFLRRF